MTFDDVLVAYTAGLETEIALLRQVEALADGQRAAFARNELADLGSFAVRRADLMHQLAAVEARVSPCRARIVAGLAIARRAPAFAAAEMRGHEAQALIRQLVERDRCFLSDLEVTLEERRREVHDLGTGNATLAAYRRVVAPGCASAGLVDSRG
jgi:hypothetical protein